jgi:hypothetical protein
MKIVNDALYVRYRPNNKLIVISSDAGDGNGEQTIMTLNPQEAIALGTKLREMGEQHRSTKS